MCDPWCSGVTNPFEYSLTSFVSLSNYFCCHGLFSFNHCIEGSSGTQSFSLTNELRREATPNKRLLIGSARSKDLTCAPRRGLSRSASPLRLTLVCEQNLWEKVRCALFSSFRYRCFDTVDQTLVLVFDMLLGKVRESLP